MVRAVKLRDGLYQILWNIDPFMELELEFRSGSAVKSEVFDSLQQHLGSCMLICKRDFNNRVGLLLKVVGIPNSLRADQGVKVLVTGVHGGVKGKMELNEFTWWDQYMQNNLLCFEIMIDMGTDFVDKGPSHVLNNLAKLWDTKTGFDMTFKCGEELIKAHTLILASGSPVFSAMFQNDFREKQDRVVEIKDTKPDVLQNLLRYIYVGKCDWLENGEEDEVADLLVAADKYDVVSLKSDCELHLSRILTVENVSKFFILGHLNNSPYLNVSALNFMASNAKSVFARKEEFMEIIRNYPDLSYKAMEKMIK